MFSKKLKVAVVCSSNQNRSMEAHGFLSKKGFYVKSYGTGDKVKLPGSSPDRPNIYDFDVSYEEMYQDLVNKDKNLYTMNGILHMLDRNRRIKPKPERFQDSLERFDVIFTCEERVYDQVVEDFETKDPEDNTPVHVINLDIQDNHEEATIGAFLFCELATEMTETDDLDNDLDEMIHDFEAKTGRTVLHSVQFYWYK